jgi:hypothetical protein
MSVCGTGQDSGHGNQATSASWLILGKARQMPVGFTQTKAYVAETKCFTGGGDSKPRTHQLIIQGKVFRLRDKSLHEGPTFIHSSRSLSRTLRQQITQRLSWKLKENLPLLECNICVIQSFVLFAEVCPRSECSESKYASA